MPRPTTKNDLIQASDEQFNKLTTLLSELTEAEKEQTFDWSSQKTGPEAHWERDQNVKDVLIHLYEWHQLLLKWVNANQNNNPQPFLPAPYNWRSYGEMNVEFTKKHQATTTKEAEELLNNSHQEVMAIIESFDNDALFSKKYFDWTGTSTLGSYCVSATSSHYEWALKKLRKFKKTLAN